MRDVLIRSHDNQAPCFTIDTARRKDVVTALHVGAEHFLVIAKTVPSLPRQKQRGHGLNGKLTMSLLKHCAHVDHCIDIIVGPRILSDRRFVILSEEIAHRRIFELGLAGLPAPAKMKILKRPSALMT